MLGRAGQTWARWLIVPRPAWALIVVPAVEAASSRFEAPGWRFYELQAVIDPDSLTIAKDFD